jgi:curved DNA-binding protein CbpA
VLPDDPPPNLPDPTATGTFAQTPLPHLLVYAFEHSLTGTFVFTGPAGEEATVLFLEGQACKVKTTLAPVYLTRVLLDQGVLTEEQLEALLPDLLASTTLHGQALIAEGIITEDQLELGLRAQLVLKMKSLVQLPPDTGYAYYDSFDHLSSFGGEAPGGIDPFALVWVAIREAPPWEHVHVGLTGVGNAGIQLAANAETSRFSFDKGERATIELLRKRPYRIHELNAAGTMPPRLVQLLVYCLLVTKQVTLIADSARSTAPVPDAAPVAPAAPSSPAISEGPDTPGNAAKVARVQLAQRPVVKPPTVGATEESSAAPNSAANPGTTSYVATQPRTKKKPDDSEGRIPAPPSSSASDLQSSAVPPTAPSGPSVDIFQIATPAVGMQAVIADMAEPATSPAGGNRASPAEVHTRPTVPKLAAVSDEQIAAHMATSPRRAASLARPPTPASIPRDVLASLPKPVAPAPAAARPPQPPPKAPAAGAPPAAGAGGLTPEQQARKKEIEDKAAVLDKEDYFAVLGVTRTTAPPEIQKAFIGLAKKWHPDRVPSALTEVKDLCAKVFAKMSEAQQTLMDEGKRKKYLESSKPGGDDSPEAQAEVLVILEAATNFQKAEICLKRNDFKQAEELCKKAIDADPKPGDYIAMMAWLQAQKPDKQDPASTQALIAELTRAIGVAPGSERAVFYRATLLKRVGQTEQAIKDFKRAMELNPRNVDAQREVRLWNMRGGDASKPASASSGGKAKEEGGLFGKLFKK